MDKQHKTTKQHHDIFCGTIKRRVRRLGDITAEQKAHNRQVQEVRPRVEHLFG